MPVCLSVLSCRVDRSSRLSEADGVAAAEGQCSVIHYAIRLIFLARQLKCRTSFNIVHLRLNSDHRPAGKLAETPSGLVNNSTSYGRHHQNHHHHHQHYGLRLKESLSATHKQRSAVEQDQEHRSHWPSVQMHSDVHASIWLQRRRRSRRLLKRHRPSRPKRPSATAIEADADISISSHTI